MFNYKGPANQEVLIKIYEPSFKKFKCIVYTLMFSTFKSPGATWPPSPGKYWGQTHHIGLVHTCFKDSANTFLLLGPN